MYANMSQGAIRIGMISAQTWREVGSRIRQSTNPPVLVRTRAHVVSWAAAHPPLQVCMYMEASR